MKKIETCEKMSFIFFNFTLLIFLASLTIPNVLARYQGPRNIDKNVPSEINITDMKQSETDTVDLDVQSITESSQSVFTKVNDNENILDSTISHVQYVSEYVTDFNSSNSENTLGQLTPVTDLVSSSSETTKIHSVDHSVLTEALKKEDTKNTDALTNISLYHVEEPPVFVPEVFSELANSVTPASQVNTEHVLPVDRNVTSSLLHKDSEITTSISQSSPSMQITKHSFSSTEKPNLNSSRKIFQNSMKIISVSDTGTSVDEVDSTLIFNEISSTSLSDTVTSTSMTGTVVTTFLTDKFISTSVSEDNIKMILYNPPSSNTETEDTAVQITNVNSGDTTNTPEYQHVSTQDVIVQITNSDSSNGADTGTVISSRIGGGTGSDFGSSSDAGTGSDIVTSTYFDTNSASTSDDSIATTESNTEDTTDCVLAPPAPKIDNIVESSRSINISWTINKEEVNGEIINFAITADFMGSNATAYGYMSEDGSCITGGNSSCCAEKIDPEEQSYILTDLMPYSVYKITVTAYTNAGSNTSEAEIVKTKADQSEPVRSLKYDFSEGGDINWKIVLKWEQPCSTWGELKGFYIYVSNISHSNEFDMEYSSSDCCTFTLPKLQSDSTYNISVAAYVDGINGSRINGSLNDLAQFKYPPGIPKISDSAAHHFTADPFATSTPTQTRITFNRDLFQGQIIWYEIIVAQRGKEEEAVNKFYANLADIPHINSWNDAIDGESYRATPEKWNPFHGKSSEVATFVLGDQKCDDNNFCNGPLKAETEYAVKIRAYTGSDRGGFQDSNITYFTTGGEVAVGVIVGILMAIIVLGSLAILFIMYRRGTLVWPPKFLKGSKQTTVRPQPILLKKFPSYCVQLLDTPNRLKNEFQLLATLSVDINAENTTVYGGQPENRKKNRYINILPYDATRVILNLVDGDQTSHYINASFIKGYSGDIEYIASQGPLEDTCEDFWRMVYQHDVRVIAMVTNLVEQNKLKCHQYYPTLRNSLVFGDMTIRCTTEINFPIHTARTLILIKEGRERKISHLHFREWPDFGVPQSTDFMLQFCQTMRHHAMAAQLGLILVHCSAGVGRTGTLIAIDILLQHISENKKVDIFGTVYRLRNQRTNMVQTEGQYTYIYRCIKDAVEDPTIVNQGTTSNSSLEPIYENVGTTLNTLQYEKLPKWRRV